LLRNNYDFFARFGPLLKTADDTFPEEMVEEPDADEDDRLSSPPLSPAAAADAEKPRLCSTHVLKFLFNDTTSSRGRAFVLFAPVARSSHFPTRFADRIFIDERYCPAGFCSRPEL